jgi:excisionase family DNA binding protein
MSEPLLSAAEVAERVGLSTKAVRRAIERGDLPASKLCGRIRVRAEDLDAWIDRNRIGASAPRTVLPTHAAVPAADGLRALLDDGRTTS